MERREFNFSWLASGALVNLSSQLVILTLNFIQGILLARLIGAEGCGAVSLITVGFLFPTTILALSLGIAAQRALSREHEKADSIVSFLVVYSLCVGLLLAMAFHIFSGPLSESLIYKSAHAEKLFVLAIPMLPALMLNMFLPRILVSADKVAKKNLIQLLRILVYIGFTVLLAGWFHGGVNGAVLALMIATFFESGAQLIIVFQIYRFSWNWDGNLIRSMFHFGIRYHGTSVLTLVFKRVEYFFLSYFLGVASVGIYSVANAFIDCLLTVARALQDVAVTAFSANTAQKTALMAARLSRFLLIFSLPLVIVAGLVVPWIIPTFYGPSFSPAIYPFLILLFVVLMFGPGPYLTTYVSIDQPGVGAMTTVIVTAANIFLTVLLIPRFGLSGNALATVLSYGVNVILGLFLFRRISGLPIKNALLLTREDVEKVRDYFRHRFA